MNSEKPILEELSVVFVGIFTPAIITPEWLEKRNIIDNTQLDFALEKETLRTRNLSFFSIPHCKIQCDESRLSITSTQAAYFDTSIKDLIRDIGETIKDTFIVKQIGINTTYHYNVVDDELWQKIGDNLVDKNVLWKDELGFKNPKLTNLIIENKKENDYNGCDRMIIGISTDKVVNITKQKLKHTLSLQFNDHYEVEEEQQKELISKIFNNEHWKEARNYTKKTIEKVYKHASS